MRKLLAVAALALAALVATGDAVLLAATCVPYGQGVCHACRSCSSCKNCAKNGGSCSVCHR